MADYSVADIDEELRRRGVATFPSVMAEEGTVGQEALKLAEAAAKGGTMGIINMLGGWGSYIDWRKKAYQGKDEAPSALSGAGIANFVKDVTGIDLQNVPGYKGAYETMQMAAPAMLLRGVAPEMSLFGPAATTRGAVAKTVGEGVVGAATGLAAESIAPDSPLAQLTIGMSPYAAKGAVMGIQNRLLKPTGTFEPSTAALLDVGRMTPGEFTGSRMQLAREAGAEVSPQIEAKGTSFRKAQARDVEKFVADTFDRASKGALATEGELAGTVVKAVNNYGKTLVNKLKQQGELDFSKAEKAGGIVDASPVAVKAVTYIDSLPENVPGTASMRGYVTSAFDRFTRDPNISISDLKTQMSLWGDAAYTGKIDGLSDVAPGTVRGVARQILGGFKESLDNAIANKVPGAAELKIAKENYFKNLQSIDNFRQSKIRRSFGKDLGDFTDVAGIEAKLEKVNGTERALLFNVLKDEAPEVAATIRQQKFDRILSNAQSTTAAANEPTLVIGRLLEEFNKNKKDASFLFPDKAERLDAIKAMRWMQQVMQSEAPSRVSAVAKGDAFAATRAVGGTSEAGYQAKELFNIVRNFFASPNAIADVVFNPDTVRNILDYQKKPTLQKGIDLIQSLPKPTAVGAARAGYMMGNQPAQEEQQIQANEYSLTDIEAELARRGQ